MRLPFTPRRIPDMPRPLHLLAGLILSLISIAMVLLLVAFLILTVGAFWLSSTTDGQRWLSAQLSSLTADSGYRIDVGQIRALGASRIGIDALAIYAGDAPVVLGKSLIITPSLAAWFDDTVAVDVQARALLLYPAPATDDAPAKTNPTRLLPDVQTLRAGLDATGLRALRIDTLDIETLALMNSTGRPSWILAPSTALSVSYDDENITLDMKGSIGGIFDNKEKLSFNAQAQAQLAGDTPALLIDHITVSAPAWSHSLQGSLRLPRTPKDITPLPLALNAPLKGDASASITATIIQDTGTFAVNDIKIDAPGVSATGQIAQKNGDRWAGTTQAEADLNILRELIPALQAAPLTGTLGATASFKGDTLTLDAPQIDYDGMQLRDIAITTQPLPDQPAGSRSITASLREAGSAAHITASAKLLMSDNSDTWQLQDIDAQLKAGTAGTATLRGAVDHGTLDMTLSSQNFRPHRLQGMLDLNVDAPFELRDFTLRVNGDLSQPVLTLATALAPVQLPQGAPAVSAAITARLGEGMLEANAVIKSRALQSGTATLRQPVTLSFKPFTFDIPAQGLEANASLAGNLSALGGFISPTLTINGQTKLDLRATGSLKTPVASGSLRVTNARLRDSSSGVALQNIALNGRFDANSIAIDSITATDGKRGTLKGSGRIGLSPGRWPADATLKLTGIDPFTRSASAISSMPVVDGVLDADLNLSGNAQRYTLKGVVGSKRLDITLPATFSSSVPQLNVVEKGARSSNTPGLDALALDIAVRIPQQIFVRGWGLDAEFGGTLQLGGTAAAPAARGTLQSLRGRYEEFGRRFTLARAKLDFRGPIPPSPYLDIIAETKVDGITAQVVLGGSASQPKISFTSDPVLPQEDVLSRILFGRERASISPTQALQMAQTLQRFSGGGQGLDPLGRLRSGFGLDDLSVDSDDDGATSVGAGKYLSDDVYLELGGGDKGGAAKVQIELTPNVKVESKVGQESGAGGGIFWEWEY